MFEHIVTFQARYRPDATAIAAPGGSISFAQLDADVNRMAGRLSGIARPGARVAVQMAGAGLHLVVLLALARLGCVSASLPAIGERAEADLVALLRPDLLLTDRAADATGTFGLTQKWLEETLRSSPEPVEPHAFAADDAVRIVVSSGTTGAPKKMLLTRRMIDARIHTGGLSQLAHRRLHAAVGLDTETGFRAPLVAWATGFPILYPPASFQWAEFLRASQPEALVLVPAQLAGLLASLPADFPPQPDLRLVLVSGSLPPALYKLACARLTSSIFVTYGSTEAGLAAQASPSLLGSGETLTGVVSPSAKVEIVDDDGCAVPWGAQGKVRVHTQEMVAGYLDDDALTARFFKDGWFYPGDLGALTATGRLTVHGREAEILDLGGLRLSPDAVEAALLDCPGVEDAGAFHVPSDEGINRVGVAVVCTEHFDRQAVETMLKRAFPQVHLRISVVDRIPRSERGKIDRRALQAGHAVLSQPSLQ